MVMQRIKANPQEVRAYASRSASLSVWARPLSKRGFDLWGAFFFFCGWIEARLFVHSDRTEGAVPTSRLVGSCET